MENRGLLFIPDISGFSRFVSATEIEHSRMIIQELLEILINANEMRLEISEVEGDAILFYKFGNPPDLEAIYSQVEKMFCAFHRNLIAYESRRYCQCKACVSAVELTLKVITHYGEFTGYNVKNFHKLIGKDVIVAHQLLKNDIPKHEYWLVTQDLLQSGRPRDFASWMKWDHSVRQTDNGEVSFEYTQLTHLKNELTPEPFPQLELAEKVKMVSAEREYDTDIITLFHATGDFRYRSRWQEGVKSIEEVNHFLPRVGMKCRCVLDSGEEMIYASSYYYQPDKIEFSETEEKKGSVTYYTLQQIAPKKIKLTLDFYIKKNLSGQFMFLLASKRKVEAKFSKSLENLVDVVSTIKLPG